MRDTALLATIPNRIDPPYLVTVETPELTFYGAPGQPDFGTVRLDYVPDQRLLELKAWKHYVHSYRDWHGSYERIATTIERDLRLLLEPLSLRVEVSFRPRGGSTATVVAGDRSLL